MARTIVSLPCGDFRVVKKPWPVECEGCWFALNRVLCSADGVVPCFEFRDYGDVTDLVDAILVPNFDPS